MSVTNFKVLDGLPVFLPSIYPPPKSNIPNASLRDVLKLKIGHCIACLHVSDILLPFFMFLDLKFFCQWENFELQYFLASLLLPWL